MKRLSANRYIVSKNEQRRKPTLQKVSDSPMSNYILSCCSTADLTEQHFLSRDIHYICFHYMLNGKQYLDDGAETRTSQINM